MKVIRPRAAKQYVTPPRTIYQQGIEYGPRGAGSITSTATSPISSTSLLMRIIFLIAILATCCHANAQIALPPKDIPSVDLDHFYDDELYHWWFGYTVEQVRDKIYSEPGWDIKKEEEGEFGSPEGVRLGASYGAGRSKEEIILVSFEFYNRKLQKRGYGFNTNNPLVQTWDAELKKYPYDDRNSRWIDKRHHAEIQRRYANDLVIYVVKMFFEDK